MGMTPQRLLCTLKGSGLLRHCARSSNSLMSIIYNVPSICPDIGHFEVQGVYLPKKLGGGGVGGVKYQNGILNRDDRRLGCGIVVKRERDCGIRTY